MKGWSSPSTREYNILSSQTTVLQCQSHKTKGRPLFHKKTSIGKHKALITASGPEERPEVQGGWNARPQAGHAGPPFLTLAF